MAEISKIIFSLPKWLETGLLFIALLAFVIKIQHGFKAHSARKNIFGGEKKATRLKEIVSFAYSLFALLLSLFFLFLYFENKAAIQVLELSLILLLVILVIEAIFKRRS
ncbi:MAG: hypothetical protein QME63_07805 [Actinomycetota bacterium]|nr:hypothetical protein [Actinomycetota bacterium]